MNPVEVHVLRKMSTVYSLPEYEVVQYNETEHKSHLCNTEYMCYNMQKPGSFRIFLIRHRST